MLHKMDTGKLWKRFLMKFKTSIRIERPFGGKALFHAIKAMSQKHTRLLLERTDMSRNAWYISVLALSMENQDLGCFEILKMKLQLWMMSHLEWFIVCLRRAAEKGSDAVIDSLLTILRCEPAVTEIVQINFLGTRTWKNIDIFSVAFEITLEQIDGCDRLG